MLLIRIHKIIDIKMKKLHSNHVTLNSYYNFCSTKGTKGKSLFI